MTAWHHSLLATLDAGMWTASEPVRRPAGVVVVSSMARLEADDIDDATVTVFLDGTVDHPGLADGWRELGSVELSPGTSIGWLGTDGMLPVPPVSHLRLRASHSGGAPSSASITLHLSADR